MITLKKVNLPEMETDLVPVTLSDETMILRKNKVLENMKKNNLDVLVIYADLEHGSNFEYLCGFLPRFEEALLVLHANGKAYMVLGNENLNKASKSRLEVIPIHMPHFSLPNQPMETDKSISEILAQCEISEAKTIGFVGWKKFTSHIEKNNHILDLPYYLIEAFKIVCPHADFYNAMDIFIGEHGVRSTNNANEFAHYEFGAALAGVCMFEAMQEIEVGKTEMQIAQKLAAYGQRHSVVTIMASGERFVKANMYPSDNIIKLGDTISMTTGFKGGLQSRGGYAVKNSQELPNSVKDYLDKLVIPYFQAVTAWLESIHIGMKGKELYDVIESVLPKKTYGWSLNPGHLCADEEWLSSPIYPESDEILQSGMLFQIDIIPSIKGYGGISCESGILLADQALRKSIEKEYPQLWQRIVTRRNYMIEVLGIQISEEILPTSMITAFCRPFLLDKESALVQVK